MIAIIKFLKELESNNNKEWFDENRDRYKAKVVEPLKDLTAELGEAFEKKIPNLNYDPRVNGSIFRMNRDVRFSKNKAPYKTNVGIFIWTGVAKKLECPGLYFHLEARKLMIGSGVYMFSPDGLTKYRKFVSTNAKGALLQKAVKKGEKSGFSLGGEKLKRVPREFGTDHKYGDLLKYKGLYLGKDFHAKEVKRDDLVKWLVKEYAPSVDFVNVLAKSLK